MVNRLSDGPCEASAVDPDSSHRVIHCNKPGTMYQEFLLPFGVYLCDEHYAQMKEKQRGQRHEP